MRDPIDRLTSLPMDETMDGLAAQDVRRLGDRRRRRRAIAGGVIGAAALVAAIAVPMALADRGTTTRPADDPTSAHEWRTTITDGTTLEPSVDGFEDRFAWEVSPDADGVGTIDLCGEPAFPLDGVVDRLAADSVPNGDGSDLAGRELRLYADDVAAEAALQEVRDAVAACPREVHDEVVWLNQEPILKGAPGESAVAVGRTYEVDGVTTPGLVMWQLVRVGNAVVGIVVHSEHGDLSAGYDLSGDTPPLVAIVEAMCVYSTAGCPGPTEPPSEGSGYESGYEGEGANIPGDFPLTRYLPTGYEYEQVDALEGGAGVELCGETIWPPQYHQSYGLMVIGPERAEVRWLAAFGDAAQAMQVVHTAHAALEECSTSDGYEVTLLGNQTGHLDVTFARTAADAGPDGAVYQLVQVGSAVLYSSSGGEITTESAPALADELTVQSTDLANEMCVFTNDGC